MSVPGLVLQWLAREAPLAHAPMHAGIIEAAKQAVATGLGISFVPDASVAVHSPDIVGSLASRCLRARYNEAAARYIVPRRGDFRIVSESECSVRFNRCRCDQGDRSGLR